jgi:uncharacterized membrane protein (UPF0136 family)
MIDLTRIYYFIFAALTIVGGVMGYVKAGSMASIIAGGVSGLLIVVAAVLLKTKVIAGLILGGVVALALVGQFAPKFFGPEGKFMPHGLMTVLGAIAIVLTIAAFIKK